MKLGERDSIHYVDDEGTVSRYQLTIDGRPVMKIAVDRLDEARVIKVARTDSTDYQPTGGRFTLKATVIEDADGGPIGMAQTRPSAMSIYEYVVPRMHRLLTRLYVPVMPETLFDA